MIKSDGVPVDEVTAAVKALHANVATLRSITQQVSDIGDDIQDTWQVVGSDDAMAG
ncbi:hypothetical protein [Kribbella sp. NPDC050470]|uniref:hypothetical protein n=1 Tax=unclassified Kribbella TaxID=2644121 RepID=UPI00378BABC4